MGKHKIAVSKKIKAVFEQVRDRLKQLGNVVAKLVGIGQEIAVISIPKKNDTNQVTG